MMTDKELRGRALRHLVRAMQEAGPALPHSWVTEGDPDLKTLRDTEDWQRLMRRLSPPKRERTAPASNDVAKQASKIAKLASTTDRRAIDAALEQLDEEPRDPVPRPEPPLRPAKIRQWGWGLAAGAFAVAAVGIVVASLDGLPWQVAALVAAILVGLAGAAGYRVHLARTERWPDLPTTAASPPEPPPVKLPP